MVKPYISFFKKNYLEARKETGKRAWTLQSRVNQLKKRILSKLRDLIEKIVKFSNQGLSNGPANVEISEGIYFPVLGSDKCCLRQPYPAVQIR